MRKEDSKNYRSFVRIASETSDKRRKEILDELDLIKSEFNVKKSVLEHVHRFYETHKNFVKDDIQKCYKFASIVLGSYGFTKEEIDDYINSNHIKLVNKISPFKFRIAVLNKCGLLENVLKTNPYILSYHSTTSTNLLYSFAESKSFNLNLEDLNKIDNILDKDAKELMNNYPLTQEKINLLYSELIEKIRKSDNNSKKLK